MMLPFRRRPTSPKPSSKSRDIDTANRAVETSSAHHSAAGLHHLDYNLEPLAVESLSHYTQPMAGERFRVH
ncbi:MAG TPA: hypothetical protein VME63_10980 [Dyella sp.]|uniref:hypothetical protein n=1 Tax=Dyella sp. TaxID=1869338 RepID=UPI002C69D706|nr:hypothetical protein [Dyella sp.]HTV85926.1 hypothetical protein [Dyella sp.]